MNMKTLKIRVFGCTWACTIAGACWGLWALFVLASVLPAAVVAAGAGLKSGPMLGYSEMEEVLIWVQTDEPAAVEIHYWKPDQPETVHKTRPVHIAVFESGLIAKCIADEVDEGAIYDYAVFIDGREVEQVYREGYRLERTHSPALPG